VPKSERSEKVFYFIEERLIQGIAEKKIEGAGGLWVSGFLQFVKIEDRAFANNHLVFPGSVW